MLINIFKSVLLMSAVGSVLAALWLCLMPVTKKLFSPLWQYYVWLTVLIVMMLPVSINIPQENTPVWFSQGIQNTVPIISTADEQSDMTNNSNGQQPKISDSRTKKSPENIIWYFSLIWFIGMILVFLTKEIKYFLFLKTIYKNSEWDNSLCDIPKRLNVRKTKLIDAPLIVGLAKPVLYLPDTEMPQKNMNYILLHELTHYKRHDILYKWFTMIVCSIHWFNPFVYAVSKQIESECEVSCDYEATKNLKDTELNDYMKMILDMLLNSKNRMQPLTTQMASGKKILKRRFTMIKNNKNTNKFMSVLSIITAASMLSAAILASGVTASSVNGEKNISIIGGTDGPTAIFVTDENTINITNNEKKVELLNNPFIANNTLYLPLREMLNAEGIKNSDIIYDNGCTEFYVHTENPVEYRNNLYDFWINRVRTDSSYVYIGGFSYGSTENDTLMRSPVLINNTTYVPYELFEKLSDSGQGIFETLSVEVKDKNKKDIQLMGKGYINDNLNFSIEIPLSWCGKYAVKKNENTVTFYNKKLYDKSGSADSTLFSIVRLDDNSSMSEQNKDAWEPVESREIMNTGKYTYIMLINGESKEQNRVLYEEFEAMRKDIDYIAASILPIVLTSDWRPENPADTVTKFFAAFEQGRFYIMEDLCTQSCLDTFLHYPDSFYGMEWAKLKNISIDKLEYAKSSNGFNIQVDVEMKPSEISVFDQTQTETTFYVCLLRQPDGKYLINEFVTGI